MRTNLALVLLVFGSYGAFAEDIVEDEIESHLLSLKCNKITYTGLIEWASNSVGGHVSYFLIDVYLLEDFSFKKNDEEWKPHHIRAKTNIYYDYKYSPPSYILSTTLSNIGLDEGRTLEIHPEYYLISNGAHSKSYDRNDPDNPNDDEIIHESNHGHIDWHDIKIDRVSLEADVTIHTHKRLDGPFIFGYTKVRDRIFDYFNTEFQDVVLGFSCSKAKEGDGMKWFSETNNAYDKQQSEKKDQRRKEILKTRQH
jgi:hypothetical protein